MTYVAQNLEDQWIDLNWSSLGLPDVGFFIELGAADGITYSNTYWLEKEKGWRGLLIEPNPVFEINNRPGSIVERCFIGSPGIASLGMCEDPFLSGALRVKTPKRIDLTSVGLSELLDKHLVSKVDLVSIDTEGTELDVWNTIDLSRHKPRVAIVELVTYGLPDISADIISAIKHSGYDLIHQTTHNGIFISNGQ